jgi:DNA (cytosine-5)-methyltransferase 1
VFLVGCPGDGADPRKILFEFDGLRRDTPPGRKAGTDVAGTLKACAGESGAQNSAEYAAGGYLQVTQALTGRLGSGGPDDNKAQGGFYVPKISQAICSKWSKGTSGPAGDEHHNLVAPPLTGNQYGGHESREKLLVAFHGSQDPDVSGDVTHPCGRNHGLETCVAFTGREHKEGARSAVRRLLPVECERLQGFPDGYTDIRYRGKPAADGPRYRALGNSMPVSVMRWIGERIERVTR